MNAYRFVSTRFPDALSPEGARRNGGRWNSKGNPVLYCARSESLALLELRVHSPLPYPRFRLKCVLEVPEDAVVELAEQDLPRGWAKLPPGPASKHVGDAWLSACKSLGLLVPSVIARDERNLILNPAHPRFAEVKVASKQRTLVDRRLYSATT